MKKLVKKLASRELFTACLLVNAFSVSAQDKVSKFIKNLFLDLTKDGFVSLLIIFGVFVVASILFIVSNFFRSTKYADKIPKRIIHRHKKVHRVNRQTDGRLTS